MNQSVAAIAATSAVQRADDMKIYQDAEEFINDIFFSSTHDSRSKLDVMEIVGQKLLADDVAKDPDYYNHRAGVVHVSSIGKCMRGIVHQLLGAEKDKEEDTRKLGVFKAGNLFEDFIIDALCDRVKERQREYRYEYKGLTLVGRSDFLIEDAGVIRVGENKSVHSDSFWYREREGTLVAWNNQIQLQIYLWLERVLNGNEYEGLFTYVSKDDVTVQGAPVKFNQRIIDEVVIPQLDIIAAAYAEKNPLLAPIPEPVVYSKGRAQWQKNWLATYCDYHEKCAGKGWVLEAGDLVARKNKESKASVPTAHTVKKAKPIITPV